MGTGAFGVEPFSTNVKLWLESEAGDHVPLAQVADSFVIAAGDDALPPCRARIVISVDGVEHERHVKLPEGMSPTSEQTAAVALDDAVPF